MKQGKNTHIERKLSELDFPFSETNWDAMAALLDQEGNKGTGGLSPLGNTGIPNGIFKSLGIIAVLLVATLGSVSQNKEMGYLPLQHESTFTPTENTTEVLPTPPTEPKSTLGAKNNTSIGLTQSNNQLLTEFKESKSAKVSSNIPSLPPKTTGPAPNLLFNQHRTIAAIDSPIGMLETKEIYPIQNPTQTSVKHPWEVQIGGGLVLNLNEQLFNQSLIFRNLTLDFNKKRSDNWSFGFNYKFSWFNNNPLFSDLALIDAEEINATANYTEQYNLGDWIYTIYGGSFSSTGQFDSNIDVRDNIFSHRIGLKANYMYHPKWNFTASLIYENINVYNFQKFHQTGLQIGLNYTLSPKWTITLETEQKVMLNSIAPNYKHHSNYGLGLKFRIK